MSEKKLNKEEKQFLIDTARLAIEKKLGIKRDAGPDASLLKGETPLLEKRGCFVTLHKKGGLRGCIGIFEGRGPLHANVEEMALQAAFDDPRFPPLSQKEYADIDVEISVLSPLRHTKDVNEIKVGEHGIYITRGYNRGVLLPQVATEYGWSRDEFLDHTCEKAGLSAGDWRKKDTGIQIFSAEVFGEKERH